jgi:hypothetical protein
MRYKATFVTGFAAGYVLGAKAGRARYEQIVRGFRTLAGRPEVTGMLGTAKRAVTDRFAGKDVTDQVHTGAVPDYAVRV